MPLVVLLILLLSGCASDSEAQLLDTYLDDSSVGTKSEALTGRALVAQEKALELVAELGWSQAGRAEYSDLRVSGNQITFCLDVSKVGFLDSNGEQVSLSRRVETLLMRANLVGEGAAQKIEHIEEAGAC